MAPTRLILNPAFPDLIARNGLSLRAFASRAGIGLSTIMALVHPDGIHRRGGMQRLTAWTLARAYAEVAGIDEETAFRLLIVEIPIHDRDEGEG